MAGPVDAMTSMLQALFAQTRERGPGEFGGSAATGGGVDDGEESDPLVARQTGNANSC